MRIWDDAVQVMTTESSFANLSQTSRSPRGTVRTGASGTVVDLGPVVNTVSSASRENKENAGMIGSRFKSAWIASVLIRCRL